MKKIKIYIRDSNYGRQYSTLTKEQDWITVKFLEYTPDPNLQEGVAYVTADKIWIAPPTEQYKAKVFVKDNITIEQITLDLI